MLCLSFSPFYSVFGSSLDFSMPSYTELIFCRDFRKVFHWILDWKSRQHKAKNFDILASSTCSSSFTSRSLYQLLNYEKYYPIFLVIHHDWVGNHVILTPSICPSHLAPYSDVISSVYVQSHVFLSSDSFFFSFFFPFVSNIRVSIWNFCRNVNILRCSSRKLLAILFLAFTINNLGVW